MKHRQGERSGAAGVHVAAGQLDEQRRWEALRVARELFEQRPDWVTFYRELLGVDGMVRQLFPQPEDYLAFEKTAEYRAILEMLQQLREQQEVVDRRDTLRVITVRIPSSVHQALRAEAEARAVSLNKLCLAKLLQPLLMIEQPTTPSASDRPGDLAGRVDEGDVSRSP